jgi:hypothetical protein
MIRITGIDFPLYHRSSRAEANGRSPFFGSAKAHISMRENRLPRFSANDFLYDNLEYNFAGELPRCRMSLTFLDHLVTS